MAREGINLEKDLKKDDEIGMLTHAFYELAE